MAFPSRLSLVKDTVDGVIRRLDALSPSAEVDELKVKAQECLARAQAQSETPPSGEERERFTKRVLALHLAVARLEKKKP